MPAQKTSAIVSATQRLRAAVQRGEYPPGQRLVQEDLALALGVSRVPVREALRTLEAEGLVMGSAKGGFFVASADLEKLRQILRIRQVLEDEAIQRLAGENSVLDSLADGLARIIIEAKQATDESDMDRVALLHRKFNILIVEAVEDPMLLRVINNLWDLSEIARATYFWLGYLTDPAHRATVENRMEAIVAAMRAHDIQKLGQLITELRDGGAEKFISLSSAQHHGRARQAQAYLRALAQPS